MGGKFWWSIIGWSKSVNWQLVIAAYILDLVIGDPRWMPHPVVMIGWMISGLEKGLRRENFSSAAKKTAGIVMVFVVVGTSIAATWALVGAANMLHPLAGTALSVFLISTTIATKGLIDSAKNVADAIASGSIDKARLGVSMIVGRDTEQMQRHDIARATIETVAENTVDAVIAPVIYALIGGAPLAMGYRAVNTLDSMIGYKNEKYADFGWAAARLDDAANYIPARISVVIIAVAAAIRRQNPKATIKTAKKFGRNHASPNSGWPEAAVAGALNLRLGGTNYYGGIPRETGYIGAGEAPLNETQISNATRLLLVSSAITVTVGCAAYIGLSVLLSHRF
jgi:adenosylcobinamide-phosphate synthase